MQEAKNSSWVHYSFPLFDSFSSCCVLQQSWQQNGTPRLGFGYRSRYNLVTLYEGLLSQGLGFSIKNVKIHLEFRASTALPLREDKRWPPATSPEL